MANYIIRWRGVLQTISTTYHKFFFVHYYIYYFINKKASRSRKQNENTPWYMFKQGRFNHQNELLTKKT